MQLLACRVLKAASAFSVRVPPQQYPPPQCDNSLIADVAEDLGTRLGVGVSQVNVTCRSAAVEIVEGTGSVDRRLAAVWKVAGTSVVLPAAAAATAATADDGASSGSGLNCQNVGSAGTGEVAGAVGTVGNMYLLASVPMSPGRPASVASLREVLHGSLESAAARSTTVAVCLPSSENLSVSARVSARLPHRRLVF